MRAVTHDGVAQAICDITERTIALAQFAIKQLLFRALLRQFPTISPHQRPCQHRTLARINHNCRLAIAVARSDAADWIGQRLAARLVNSPTTRVRVYAHEIEGHDRAAAVKFGLSVARRGSELPGESVATPEEVPNS